MIISRARIAGVSNATVDRFVVKVRKSTRVRGIVNVLLTTNKEMKTLNARFRRKNEPTDVLSFPAEEGSPLAGEIAISLEIAKINANQLGHSTIEEVKILILHGMLHLASYDHETDRGEMFREEQRLRKELNLPTGLIERQSTTKPLARRFSSTPPARLAR